MVRILLIFAALALPGAAADAQRLPGARSLSTTDWGYAIAAAPTRAGSQAQRFELRAGDCAANGGGDDCTRDRERSEFRPDAEWRPESDVWIGFSVLLPADFPVSDRVNTTIAQIHQRGGPERQTGGQTARPPVMQLVLRGDWLRLIVYVPDGPNLSRDVMPVADFRGGWHDVILRFDSRAPRLGLWIDGQERADVAGWQTPPPQGYYFKYGLYRSFVSRHGGPMPTQIAWFDEVRIGTSRAAVQVDPRHPVD